MPINVRQNIEITGMIASYELLIYDNIFLFNGNPMTPSLIQFKDYIVFFSNWPKLHLQIDFILMSVVEKTFEPLIKSLKLGTKNQIVMGPKNTVTM